jgi:hypothetical protein
MSFAAIILCVASQRVFVVVVVYFAINSVRELLDTPSHVINMFQGDRTALAIHDTKEAEGNKWRLCSVFIFNKTLRSCILFRDILLSTEHGELSFHQHPQWKFPAGNDMKTWSSSPNIHTLGHSPG